MQLQDKLRVQHKEKFSLPPLGYTHAVQGRLLDASINGCQDLDVIGTGAIWKGLISQTLKVVAQAIDDWISIQRA